MQKQLNRSKTESEMNQMIFLLLRGRLKMSCENWRSEVDAVALNV
jgi:hypothetical protein